MFPIHIRTHLIVQAIGVAAQIANQVTPVVPPKYQGVAAGVIAILQGVTAILAHYSTPAGTKIPPDK